MKFPSVYKATKPWQSCVNSPRTHSFKYAVHHENSDDESAIKTALKSKRLLFDPIETTTGSSSILEEAKGLLIDSELVVVDSIDPFFDFRVSMEEMIDVYGLEDWEMVLECYLKMNLESNHRFILEAFIDLLLHISMKSNGSECSASSISTRTSGLSLLRPEDVEKSSECSSSQ